jgi:hypothetical protein
MPWERVPLKKQGPAANRHSYSEWPKNRIDGKPALHQPALLVDPTPGTTLLTLAALQNEAERLLGVSVDVQTPKSLSARFRDQVLKQALAV